MHQILTGKEAVWDHPDKGAAIRVGLFYSLDKQVEHDPEEKKQIDGEWEAAAPKQAPGDQTGQESPNLIGDRLFGLVKPCWSADPSQRPSMARLIQTYRDLTAAGGLEEARLIQSDSIRELTDCCRLRIAGLSTCYRVL